MQRTDHARSQIVVFAIKKTLLQGRRLIEDSRSPGRLSATPIDPSVPIAAESRSGFWTDATLAERRLQLGKIQNLRLAIRHLHGVRVGAGEEFSFWRQVGRATRRRGFAVGREVREGCIIPSVGGGLCQLSNALYDLALKTDCEIVERHPHTIAVPGSAAEHGRDATVFWNYIDLRFRPRTDCQIEALLTPDELVLRFRMLPTESKVETRSSHLRVLQQAGSCVTCGHDGCARHAPELAWDEGDFLTSFLLDAVTPEWMAYVEAARAKGKSQVIVPIDGRRWRMTRYAWPHGDETVALTALGRAWRARRYASSPPSVSRHQQLMSDLRVALAMSRKISPEADTLVVSQSLLPGLWESGMLAGRRFEVLMVRLPMVALQDRLDAAFAANPEQTLLNDFRADPRLVAFETAALEAADQIVTPHPGVAALFPGRSRLVDWQSTVKPVSRKPEPLMVFPGPTAARKGAYAVREAARQLGLRVAVLGKNLEHPDFWEGVELKPADDWLARGSVIVQPSISEDRPANLLRAQAAGIPIIATEMCGLPSGSYHHVSFGDVDGIVEAIKNIQRL